jgi:hypothetical protein
MSLQPRHRIDFDDWLAAERAALEGRSEYADGEIFAMSGGSERHNLIATNIVGELRSQFKGRPCYVYASDMKVRIASAKVGAYPDVMAICGERQFYDERRDMVVQSDPDRRGPVRLHRGLRPRRQIRPLPSPAEPQVLPADLMGRTEWLFVAGRLLPLVRCLVERAPSRLRVRSPVSPRRWLLRGCEKTSSLLRTSPDAPGGVAQSRKSGRVGRLRSPIFGLPRLAEHARGRPRDGRRFFRNR